MISTEEGENFKIVVVNVPRHTDLLKYIQQNPGLRLHQINFNHTFSELSNGKIIPEVDSSFPVAPPGYGNPPLLINYLIQCKTEESLKFLKTALDLLMQYENGVTPIPYVLSCLSSRWKVEKSVYKI